MNNISQEKTLLEGLAKEDKASIEQIYRDNYSMIQSLILNNSGTTDDAADIFQEAMIVLFEKSRTADFELNCQLKTYLYSVCRRLWLKKLQQMQRFGRQSEDMEEMVPVEDDLEMHEKRQLDFNIMENAMSKIGEPCKSLLEAYYIHKKQMQQIATEFGYTNADNAKTQKYKCLVRLKKLFLHNIKTDNKMEDTLLIDAAERFARGEMTAEEKIFFEELRKKNPELDQLVVEQLFFLNELERYGSTKNFKHILHETESKLVTEGLITKSPLQGKSKVVYLWKRYKRTIAVAASIAGIVSILSATLISVFHNEKNKDINLLVGQINEQSKEIRKIKNKTDQLAAASETPAIVTPEPIDAKFRATGFLIDVNNNLIVTNAHVVKEARNRLVIENNKGAQFTAEAIYVNESSDIAILKVRDNTFKKMISIPYSIRKTNAELGEQVFMLGFPKQEIVYGEGYISAKNGYKMDTIYCQLSTSANEGNSGSPVITKNGELVGIITSMETNAEGVVFAIKSANIYKAIEEVKKMKGFEDTKITSQASLKGTDRVAQIKKVEDYVFMVKGN